MVDITLSPTLPWSVVVLTSAHPPVGQVSVTFKKASKARDMPEQLPLED